MFPRFVVITLLILASALAALAEPPLVEPGEPGIARSVSPFLLQNTDARIRISGPVVRAEVTQTWANPNDVAVDGLYVFPLPERAAVSAMRIVVGERVIEAEIKERDEARKIYEQAKREGRTAALLDQERPNVFAQRVANIAPGESIRVVVAYEEPLAPEDGAYELVFPTVVGPRFVPAEQADPGEIAPPVDLSGEAARHALEIAVELEAGMTIRDLGSPSHAVSIEQAGDTRATVTLEGENRLDRDFRLRWSLAGDAPEVGLVAWRDADAADGLGAFALTLQPPADPDDAEITPREIVFVLDCSGSMQGVPLRAAKEVVRRTLTNLRADDTFRIIRFSERASGLGPAPLANTPENVKRALRYLDGLTGSGGTRMIEGIRAALAGEPDEGRMRIVAFLTDGYIGNETQILAEVQRTIGDARIFSFGVGSSVNRYLLESLAEEGRGAADFQAPRESPDALVERFLRRIDAPVLTDVRVRFVDIDVGDVEPRVIPDLFAGQPLVLTGRYAEPGSGVVIVDGLQNGEPVRLRRVVTLYDDQPRNEAIGRIWARARIHRLSREMLRGEKDAAREAITALGLRYGLATPWTSFVAVDSERVANPSGESTSVEVPVELPQDVPTSALGGATRGTMRQKVRWVRKFQPPVASLESADVAEKRRPAPAPPIRFRELRVLSDEGAWIVVTPDGRVVLERPSGARETHRLDAGRLSTLEKLVRALVRGGAASGGASPDVIVLLEDGRRVAFARGDDAELIARITAMLKAR